MAVDAKQYFNGLRSYLHSHYQILSRDDGRMVLEEKIYLSGQTKPTTYKVRLGFDGEIIVIHLDKKAQKTRMKKIIVARAVRNDYFIFWKMNRSHGQKDVTLLFFNLAKIESTYTASNSSPHPCLTA